MDLTAIDAGWDVGVAFTSVILLNERHTTYQTL